VDTTVVETDVHHPNADNLRDAQIFFHASRIVVGDRSE
jgi:hypothetical protein